EIVLTLGRYGDGLPERRDLSAPPILRLIHPCGVEPVLSSLCSIIVGGDIELSELGEVSRKPASKRPKYVGQTKRVHRAGEQTARCANPEPCEPRFEFTCSLVAIGKAGDAARCLGLTEERRDLEH